MRSPSLTLLSLAVGGLCIGTTEFAAMGLLPFIARDLSASIPLAGWTITAYALGVVVGAPLLTILAARMDRKRLLVLLMAFYSAANLASAFVPSLGWLVLSRFLAGLPHGAFFGVGSVMGAHVAGADKRGRAMAIMLAGLTVANVVGVPLVTAAGMVLGWRLSFVGVSALGLVTLVGVAWLAPRLPVDAQSTIRREMKALGHGPLWLAFASAAIGFGGMFAVYSYVSPLLTDAAHLDISWVPWVLSLFGMGMTLGTLTSGRALDHSVPAATLAGFGGTAVILLVIGLFAANPWVAVPSLFFLGFVTAYIAMPMQARLMDLSPQAPSLGAALSHSALNIGNASGAAFGGLVLALGWGDLAPAWVGLALTLLGGSLFLVTVLNPRLGAPHRG